MEKDVLRFNQLSPGAKQIVSAAADYLSLLGPSATYWYFLFALPYNLCYLAECDQIKAHRANRPQNSRSGCPGGPNWIGPLYG